MIAAPNRHRYGDEHPPAAALHTSPDAGQSGEFASIAEHVGPGNELSHERQGRAWHVAPTNAEQFASVAQVVAVQLPSLCRQ